MCTLSNFIHWEIIWKVTSSYLRATIFHTCFQNKQGMMSDMRIFTVKAFLYSTKSRLCSENSKSKSTSKECFSVSKHLYGTQLTAKMATVESSKQRGVGMRISNFFRKFFTPIKSNQIKSKKKKKKSVKQTKNPARNTSSASSSTFRLNSSTSSSIF